jgi:hypothetical protein
LALPLPLALHQFLLQYQYVPIGNNSSPGYIPTPIPTGYFFYTVGFSHT